MLDRLRGIHPYAYGRIVCFCFLFFKVAFASNERLRITKMGLLVDFILWLRKTKGLFLLLFFFWRTAVGKREAGTGHGVYGDFWLLIPAWGAGSDIVHLIGTQVLHRNRVR